jgi:drug/metabolite transporter (DMT)-like permease
MSWKRIICAGAILAGVILFLYGANYYNAIIGWVGFSLVISGFFGEIVSIVYERVRKKESGQKL